MEEYNIYLHDAMLEVVENQIQQNNPPDTRATLERLIKEGYTEEESKEMIIEVVAVEVYEIMKHQKQFNLERYQKNLNKLPYLPYDQDDK